MERWKRGASTSAVALLRRCESTRHPGRSDASGTRAALRAGNCGRFDSLPEVPSGCAPSASRIRGGGARAYRKRHFAHYVRNVCTEPQSAGLRTPREASGRSRSAAVRSALGSGMAPAPRIFPAVSKPASPNPERHYFRLAKQRALCQSGWALSARPSRAWDAVDEGSFG